MTNYYCWNYAADVQLIIYGFAFESVLRLYVVYLLNLFLFHILKVGKYREALGKWESAITLMPEKATLHEQKAQVLLEIGETWKSLMAATREYL